MSNSWPPHGPQPTRLLCPWDSPSKNTEVSCHALFQGILPTQGWNPYLLCLLYCQMDSLLLAPREKSQSNYTPIKKKHVMMAPFTLLLMLLSLSWLEPLMESCWFISFTNHVSLCFIAVPQDTVKGLDWVDGRIDGGIDRSKSSSFSEDFQLISFN